MAEHLGRGKFVVVVGGEHSVSIGAIEAQVEWELRRQMGKGKMAVGGLDSRFRGNDSVRGNDGGGVQAGGMSVLQLDAHADLRDAYEGSKYNHACVMARAREFCPVVQVGIRSMDAGEKEFMEAGNVFFAEDIVGQGAACAARLHTLRRGRGSGDWRKQVVERLGEKVYVTVDLDVFDPGVMPATGRRSRGGWDGMML